MAPLAATILVLVVTNRNLILAADSRKTILHPDGTLECGTIDKIYQCNDSYFAVTGLHSAEDNSFAIPFLLDKILRSFDDFEQAVSKLAAALAAELKSYFVHLKQVSPALFFQFQKYSGSGGEVFLVKRVFKKPVAYLIDYRVSDGAPLRVVVNTCKAEVTKFKTSEACFWRAAGNTDFLKTLFLSGKEMGRDPAEKARWIIEEGIRQQPTFVGGPINLLELSESGERWIERSATAPNRILLK